MSSVTQQSYARIGLIGNPSDGYGGKTLSVICKNFSAQVTLVESERLTIEPDLHQFDSLAALSRHIDSEGYYGASRLFKATIKVFSEYLAAYQPQLSVAANFSVQYKTNIPRLVGLAGSSALVVALLKALLQFYNVEVDKRVLPSLALAVERDELNIGGGLQDRVIQCYEGAVAMDFSQTSTIDGYVCGHYAELDTTQLPLLYMAYSIDGGEPTEVFHNDLQARYNAGEKAVVDAMTELAALTDEALSALQSADYQLLSRCMDRNFDIRRSISNLNRHHIDMIETARACGVCAKYAGSGGAVVGIVDNEDQFAELERRFAVIGCKVVRPVIV